MKHFYAPWKWYFGSRRTKSLGSWRAFQLRPTSPHNTWRFLLFRFQWNFASFVGTGLTLSFRKHIFIHIFTGLTILLTILAELWPLNHIILHTILMNTTTFLWIFRICGKISRMFDILVILRTFLFIFWMLKQLHLFLLTCTQLWYLLWLNDLYLLIRLLWVESWLGMFLDDINVLSLHRFLQMVFLVLVHWLWI